jgi:hypothetical protein
MTNFALLLLEINLCKMRIVINKGNIIFITMRRYNGIRASYIGVNYF